MSVAEDDVELLLSPVPQKRKQCTSVKETLRVADVNEILVDVLQCVPCLQVTTNRDLSKRLRNLIEAQGDYWMPKEVTLGMLKIFKEELNFDRLTNYRNDYCTQEGDQFEVLEPREVAAEVEKCPADGFAMRDLQAVRLLARWTYQNLPMGGADPCHKYCTRDCPNKTDPRMEHLSTLEGLVSVDEVMTLLSHVMIDHYEICVDTSAFSTELVRRLLRDERIKAAKTLAIGAVTGLLDITTGVRAVEEWGGVWTTDHVISYLLSPGNEERVLFLDDLALDQFFVDLMLRIIQEFVTASETKHFGRMLFVDIDDTTLSQCVEHLRSLGHIPLVILNTPQKDKTTTFIFKNERSGEALRLKFGMQIVTKSVNNLEGIVMQVVNHAFGTLSFGRSSRPASPCDRRPSRVVPN